jgi:hypothetical protein
MRRSIFRSCWCASSTTSEAVVELREMEREKHELHRELRELKKERDKHMALLPIYTNLAELPSGFVLDNKYRLESLIGTGGFGVVYRATHIQLQRQVAVKVFRPLTNLSTEDSLRRFRHEGASASRLQHPNAVTVLDSGVALGGIPYLAMELLIGRTLAEELKERRVLSLSAHDPDHPARLRCADRSTRCDAGSPRHQARERVFAPDSVGRSDQDPRLWHCQDAGRWQRTGSEADDRLVVGSSVPRRTWHPSDFVRGPTMVGAMSTASA